MVEQIVVAGDDCIGSGFAGKRYEIVVIGIAKQCLDFLGVVVLDGCLIHAGHNLV